MPTVSIRFHSGSAFCSLNKRTLDQMYNGSCPSEGWSFRQSTSCRHLSRTLHSDLNSRGPARAGQVRRRCARLDVHVRERAPVTASAPRIAPLSQMATRESDLPYVVVAEFFQRRANERLTSATAPFFEKRATEGLNLSVFRYSLPDRGHNASRRLLAEVRRDGKAQYTRGDALCHVEASARGMRKVGLVR
jgi:hypothetical protein